MSVSFPPTAPSASASTATPLGRPSSHPLCSAPHHRNQSPKKGTHQRQKTHECAIRFSFSPLILYLGVRWCRIGGIRVALRLFRQERDERHSEKRLFTVRVYMLQGVAASLFRSYLPRQVATSLPPALPLPNIARDRRRHGRKGASQPTKPAAFLSLFLARVLAAFSLPLSQKKRAWASFRPSVRPPPRSGSGSGSSSLRRSSERTA